jgi:peptidoglycan-N-acetylglucosamine deacetylase
MMMSRMVRALPWGRPLVAVPAVGLAAAVAERAAGGTVPLPTIGALALATVAGFASALASVRSGLFARPVIGADPGTSGRRLALTFDDGPDPVHTRAVLDLLDSRGHRATFFVIGARGERHVDLLDEIVRRGHGLGNHSYRHSWATPALPVRRLVADLERAQATLRRVGPAPRWFRPPIGIVSPRIAAAARRTGLTLVGWTASARDGTRTDPGRALRRLLRVARPGAILALHDAAEHGTHEPAVRRLLPPLLDALDARGLRSVTLDELLGRPE